MERKGNSILIAERIRNLVGNSRETNWARKLTDNNDSLDKQVKNKRGVTLISKAHYEAKSSTLTLVDDATTTPSFVTGKITGLILRVLQGYKKGVSADKQRNNKGKVGKGHRR